MLAKLEAASHKWNRWIVSLFGGVIFMTLTFMLVFESLRRTIVDKSIWGLYDISEILNVWLVITAFAYALITAYHVRVTLVLDRLPTKGRLACEIIASLIGIAMFSFLLWGAIPHAWDSFVLKETPMSPARVPMYLGKIGMVPGLALMLIQFIIRFARQVRPTREVIEEIIKEKEKVTGF